MDGFAFSPDGSCWRREGRWVAPPLGPGDGRGSREEHRKEKDVVFRIPEFGFLSGGAGIVQFDGQRPDGLEGFGSRAGPDDRDLPESREPQHLAGRSGSRHVANGTRVRLWTLRGEACPRPGRRRERHRLRVRAGRRDRGGRLRRSSHLFWNLKSGEEVGRQIALKGYGFDLAYSPDGKRLSCSEFNVLQQRLSVTLWDVVARRALWTNVRAVQNRSPLVVSPTAACWRARSTASRSGTPPRGRTRSPRPAIVPP
jgi:hypothetical protein